MANPPSPTIAPALAAQPGKPARATPGDGAPSLVLLALDDILGLSQARAHLYQKKPPLPGKSDFSFSSDEREVVSHFEEGVQKTLDLIAPAAMEVRRNEIVLNDLYARTLYAYNWPSFLYPNWLSSLVNFDARMDICHFIYPSSNKVIMKMLRKKVAEMRSSVRMLEQRGIVRDPTIEAALQDAEELRDLLARGSEKLFQFGMYITLYADDETKLKKLQADVETLLGGRLILTKPAFYQMEHAWISTLPICRDELEVNRNMNTSPIATSFPFSSSDLTDDHGILYGINRHNDSLVIFDRFDLPNANGTIFATSGAGKSFTAKLEILRSLMFDTEVFIIDPENEYVELAKTVGGTFIPISLQGSNSINPFDLPKSIRGADAKIGEELRASVISLHGLFKLMLGTLTPAEDSLLDKAILDTYALKKITLQTEDTSTLQPPTMHDLVEVLMTTQGAENMANTLQKYTAGSYAGLFDQPTNVQLDKQLVTFQIRDLEDNLRPIAMYVVLNFLWNSIRSELKRRLLIIDEAWNLMQHDDSARFLYGLIKRARKYYLGVTTITQDIEDFVNSPYGKPIITNSSMQLLLKQNASAVDNLQKLFYLTEGEKSLLLNSDVGQGLFFANNRHVAIEIIASPHEEKIITTKPEEILRKKQETQEHAHPATPEEAAMRFAEEIKLRREERQWKEKTGKQTGAGLPSGTPVEENAPARDAAEPAPAEPAAAEPPEQTETAPPEPAAAEPPKRPSSAPKEDLLLMQATPAQPGKEEEEKEGH